MMNKLKIQTAKRLPKTEKFITLEKDNIKEVFELLFGKEKLKPLLDDPTLWDNYQEDVIKNGLRLKTPESGGETQLAFIGYKIMIGWTKKLGKHFWPVDPEYFNQFYEIQNK